MPGGAYNPPSRSRSQGHLDRMLKRSSARALGYSTGPDRGSVYTVSASFAVVLVFVSLSIMEGPSYRSGSEMEKKVKERQKEGNGEKLQGQVSRMGQ